MQVQSLKELRKLIQLCRATGVASIEVDGMKITLGDAPKTAAGSFADDKIITEPEYSDEDLAMWSAAPHG